MKAAAHQSRQVAAVVYVGMREQHRGNVFAGKWETPVALLGFLSPALKQSAIEQVILALNCKLMHGAGDDAGGAPKGEFHSNP